MKTIQVALDLFTTEETLKILEEVAEYVDIIELVESSHETLDK